MPALWLFMRLAGKRVLGAISGPLGWLAADARRWLALLLLCACAGLWWQNTRISHWRTMAGVERAAHLATISGYQAAAAEAQRRAIANRDRVEAAWAAQLERAVNEKQNLERDYRQRLAVWLRQQPPASDRRASGGADLPDAAAVSGGAVPDAAAAIVPVTDLERCAAAFAQLQALIGWVTAAGAVETD